MVLSGTSCKRDSKRAAFEMRYLMEIEIPAGLNVFTFHQFPVQKEASGINFFLDQANLNPEDIVAINTSFGRVTTLLGDEDLSIIDEIVIDLFRTDDNRLNYEAAYTFQIPIRRLSRIDLVPSITNLKEVLLKDEFDLVMHVRFRGIPPRNFTVLLEIGFEAFRD
ncbi:MAG: hypothetical protein EA409_01210 [Saprospirales bacterium]|nr:MAG: hypothetical protein EA409_01210 [Saprospirales bacterium]